MTEPHGPATAAPDGAGPLPSRARLDERGRLDAPEAAQDHLPTLHSRALTPAVSSIAAASASGRPTTAVKLP